METNGILNIDLVVMNLYPFEATVKSGAFFETCIENIDIGGPSMLRSSAKVNIRSYQYNECDLKVSIKCILLFCYQNHAYVTVITTPSQYQALIQEMALNDGCTSLSSRCFGFFSQS